MNEIALFNPSLARAWLIASVVVLCVLIAPTRADESLATVVPAEAALFIELRQAEDLLVPLVEPQLWLTLAELAGQPAALNDTAEWRRRVEQTVRMSPTDAIRTLFSRRVAFVGASIRNTEDAVVLCRPAEEPRQLVRRWQAQPLATAGRTGIYRLPYNLGLAVRDDLVVFGDQVERGLFADVVRRLDGNPIVTLADDPRFQHMLARVPPDPEGVLFARLLGRSTGATASTDSRPADGSDSPVALPALPELPRLLRGSSSMLLALKRDGRLLHISVVGDGPAATAPTDGSGAELLARLPERTLLAWAGQVDYPGLLRATQSLPERSVFRVSFQLLERAGLIDRLAGALQRSACVAVGTVVPAQRQVAAPPIPAAAILIRTSDAAAATAAWGDVFHHTVALYRLLSLKLANPPQLPPIETLTVANNAAEVLDLGPLVAPTLGLTPLGELHLAWAIEGDVLIVATHVDWLRQILEARQSGQIGLRSVLDLSRLPPSEQPDTLLVVQTGPLADLGRAWLRYFEEALPFVLSEDWWRQYQPGGNNMRLGIQVIQDPQRQRLRVQAVTPGAPAADYLRPGDEIIGCNGRRFATSQPVVELRRGLQRRPNARWFDVWIERDRIVLARRIPMPFVDPVEILRRAVAIGQLVQRIVYADRLTGAGGPLGYLTVELRGDEGPLFEFATQPVAARGLGSTPAGH